MSNELQMFSLTLIRLTPNLGLSPSIFEAAHDLKLPVEDFDDNFGIVLVDPECSLFAAKIREGDHPYQVYSDPKISSGKRNVD